MRRFNAAAIAAVLLSSLAFVPVSALAAKAAKPEAVKVSITTKSTMPTDVSARKKLRTVKVKRMRAVRMARADATPHEFCGDRYCGVGGQYERQFGRGMAKAAKVSARGIARAPGGIIRAGGGLIARAEAHLGATASQLGLPRSLWCADFMNKIAPGYNTDRRAISWAKVGRPASRGCIGCVAVLTRGKRGGHVGVVKGWQGGNPVIVSGNHNRRVGVGVYPAGRLVALRDV